ncbi:MAG: iron ABC transporter permease [Mycoplasmoidaceae bacterium]
MKQNKNRFTFYKTLFNYKKIIFLTAIVVSFITVFFICLFNNGLSFISPKDILNETLLKTLVGFSAGFSLAASGAAMQSVTRNELAGPTTLGFLPAASFGIILYKIMDFPSIPLLILFAFVFALFILAVNFFVCKINKNDVKGYRVILIGVIIGALFSSVSIVLNTVIPKLNESLIPWLGQVSIDYNWEKASYTFPAMIIGVMIIMSISKKLNIVEKDPFLAKSLGINVDHIYWTSGIASVLITVSSVILVGSIAMIGIIVPHLIRMLFRTRNYSLITPLSGLLCGTITMVALMINSRWSVGPNLFATVLSAPVFVFLILRKEGNKDD